LRKGSLARWEGVTVIWEDAFIVHFQSFTMCRELN